MSKIQASKKIQNEKSLKKNIEILIKNKKNTKSLIKKVKKLGDKILISTKKEIENTIIKWKLRSQIFGIKKNQT